MASTWMEVFRTGTHTAGNGTTKTYTEADLKEMCAKYNGQKDHEAPLVIGHPTENGPAYGWTKELKVVGQKLMAFIDGITDEVVDAIKKQHYKKISIALYADNLLRHIGLLGATPPAVKGLTPVSFASGVDFVEYAWATDEYRIPIVGRILSGIRDFFIEKFGLETADKILGKDDINRLLTPAEETLLPETQPEKGISPFNQPSQEEHDMEKAEVDAIVTAALAVQAKTFGEQITAITGTITEVSNSVKALSDTLAAEKKKVTGDAETAAFNESVSTFKTNVESLVKAGKVLDAERDGLVEEYSDLLKAEKVLTFAEGEKRPTVKFRERLEARAVINKPTEKQFADGNRRAPGTTLEGIPESFKSFAEIDESGLAMDKAIKIYQEDYKVTYEEAAAAYAQGKA